jgi:RNA:NAD 2'-phosphotransferase (TPT1/KptA family)
MVLCLCECDLENCRNGVKVWYFPVLSVHILCKELASKHRGCQSMSKSTTDISLSKTLSWLLRHAATKEGLPLSSEGFVPVSQILNHRQLRGKYTVDDVKRVVANNNKQRFSLRASGGVLEIRANQGHSLPVSARLDRFR